MSQKLKTTQKDHNKKYVKKISIKVVSLSDKQRTRIIQAQCVYTKH